MRLDFSKSTSPNRQEFGLPTPKPGEIWEVNRFVRSPLEFSKQEQQNLYSETAQRFLQGNSPPRYVMIVREPEPLVDPQEEWQVVSVMLLSGETNFSSDVNLLVPREISGIGRDVLAETWHVLLMLTCNLWQRVGQRLSREIYDVLLDVGDCYHGSIEQAPSYQEIQALGLQVGTLWTEQQPEIQAFHQQEEAWSDVLSVPVAAYRTYLKAMKLTDAILEEALKLDRFSNLTSSLVENGAKGLGSHHQPIVLLTNWLHNSFETGWSANLSDLAPAVRNAEHFHETHSDSEEIAELINQLSTEQDEPQRRKAAKQLGDIANGNDRAIQALIDLMRTTRDDETLWTAVESLWQIDPGNPAAGVRRVKLLDLGMQVAGQTVALAVAILQKSDRQVGVLLRVYPTGNEPYLPSDLKLILLDTSGQILREVTARRADVYIQLKLSGEPGEKFSVRVALGEASITEDFAL